VLRPGAPGAGLRRRTGFDPRPALPIRKAGKIVALRRGRYTLAERYRRGPLSPARLANQLYRPSYLSGLWALGTHGLIPERVVWLTSVTPRPPRRFENPFGVFDYRSLKRDAFFGYTTLPYNERDVLVAEPEKALLDHWHLGPGEWTTERLAEMRYQSTDRVSARKLRRYAAPGVRRRDGAPLPPLSSALLGEARLLDGLARRVCRQELDGEGEA